MDRADYLLSVVGWCAAVTYSYGRAQQQPPTAARGGGGAAKKLSMLARPAAPRNNTVAALGESYTETPSLLLTR